MQLGCKGEVSSAIQELRRNHFVALPYGPFQVEVFLPLLSYHEQVLKRRVRREVEGVPAHFVSPEDLVILKMLFYRSKDLADAKAILVTLHGKLDTGYIQKNFEDLLPAEDRQRRCQH
ncbi:MAG: hypothetical protein HY717_04435 [Planctomycetes bacterium]|nr:hypothetical protein [Planctomycetota bacterium]